MSSVQGKSSILDRSMRSILVGNIPNDVGEDILRNLFSEYGPILNIRLFKDGPSGYAFCEYGDPEMALRAVHNLTNYELKGRILKIDIAASETSKEQLAHLQPVEGLTHNNEILQAADSSEKAPEEISKAVASLPAEQMFELMKQMKMCIENNPQEARNLLLQNPQLAYALLQAQVIMRIVDPEVAVKILNRPTVAPATTEPETSKTNPEPIEQSLPSVANPAELTSVGDQDMRQLPSMDLDMRQATIGSADKDMRQIAGDIDLRTLGPAGGLADKRSFDPRFRDPRVTPGTDPRMMQGTDPRMMQGTDPRMMQGTDPRMMQSTDPRMMQGADPRMMQGTDPRMMQGTDPRMMQGTDPRMMQGTDQRHVQSHADPRMMQGTDPRMAPGADPRSMQGGDPRVMQGSDPRMMQGTDTRVMQAADPRMMPVDPRISTADPRGIQGADPRAVQVTDPRTASQPDSRAVSGSDPRGVHGMDPRTMSGSDPRMVPGTDVVSRMQLPGSAFGQRSGANVDPRSAPVSTRVEDPRKFSSAGVAVSVRMPANTRIPATSSASVSLPGIPPSTLLGPRSNAPPSAGAKVPEDEEKAALIMQVLQLSEEQIAMLPPEQRQSIIVLKEQIARSQLAL